MLGFSVGSAVCVVVAAREDHLVLLPLCRIVVYVVCVGRMASVADVPRTALTDSVGCCPDCVPVPCDVSVGEPEVCADVLRFGVLEVVCPDGGSGPELADRVCPDCDFVTVVRVTDYVSLLAVDMFGGLGVGHVCRVCPWCEGSCYHVWSCNDVLTELLCGALWSLLHSYYGYAVVIWTVCEVCVTGGLGVVKPSDESPARWESVPNRRWYMTEFEMSGAPLVRVWDMSVWYVWDWWVAAYVGDVSDLVCSGELSRDSV